EPDQRDRHAGAVRGPGLPDADRAHHPEPGGGGQRPGVQRAFAGAAGGAAQRDPGRRRLPERAVGAEGGGAARADQEQGHAGRRARRRGVPRGDRRRPPAVRGRLGRGLLRADPPGRLVRPIGTDVTGRRPARRSPWRRGGAAFDRALELVLALTVALTSLAILLQVFCRYVLNAPFSWPEEFAVLLFGWMILLGAAV